MYDTSKFDANRGRKCSESGKPLCYQQDGARIHTAQLNKQVFSVHGKMKRFEIEVLAQPVQNPDMNVGKLAFFLQLPD